jgi:hypothetical protein
MQVTTDDIDWFMKEMDSGRDALISEDEFVCGLSQWVEEGKVKGVFDTRI